MSTTRYPSVQVMDEAARRLGAPCHQSFLAVASDSMRSAFLLICDLIARHEPPDGSPEAETSKDLGEIPNAMAAFPGFKGFRPDFQEFASRLDILVDDVPQTRVMAYDVEAGTVTRLKGEGGGMVSLRRARDPANQEVVKGTVTIIDREA